MWNTNIHEQLITGDKRFEVVPDGRRYAIDLVQGTVSEGNDGDLVVWVQRPESLNPGQKYSWYCGMAAPGGGLQTGQEYAMLRAPVGDYTNIFAPYIEYLNPAAHEGMTLGNRFYIQLRAGQMYGRLSADFWTTDRSNPSMGLVHVSYAINPSGSRLLR